MKRGRKLIRNICMIAILLCGFYYLGGFYLSKEECVRDSIRGLYGTENEIIMEFQNRNIITSIVINEEEKTVSMIGTKKLGFLYCTASSATGHKVEDDECLDFFGGYSSERGSQVVTLYRNDNRIERVEVSFADGNIITIDEWIKNFAAYSVEIDGWQRVTYRAYDASGKLIDEIEY